MSHIATRATLYPATTAAAAPHNRVPASSEIAHSFDPQRCMSDVARRSVDWSRQFNELTLRVDSKEQIIWQSMRPHDRPSFTPGLLRDIISAQDTIEEAFARSDRREPPAAKYVVLASELPGIFNLGGDLPHFIRAIEEQDDARLRWYAHLCARGQHRIATSFAAPVCTIALVQGDALGGGFEVALAHDVIIAERRAQFGLPEVLFNLFPGMGAYSFLARRTDARTAERMILSGKVYSADELHELGIVDRVVDDGEGAAAIYEFIREFERARTTRLSVLQARKLVHPITLAELVGIADIWVDAALELSAADLRKMRHLAKAQDRRWAKLGHA